MLYMPDPPVAGASLAQSPGIRITLHIVYMEKWDVLSALPSQEFGAYLQCLQWKNTFLC